LQYFFPNPGLSFITEVFYRHKILEVESRSTDTSANDDYNERVKQADASKMNLVVGVKGGNTAGNKNIQTRLYYSINEEKVFLGIGLSF